jgi:sarcosine oxidase subunit alpha
MIDLLIIGAGPAGLSAAIAGAECSSGFHIRIVDEFIKPGGRLLGQLHQEPGGNWWNGIEEAERLRTRALQLGVKIQVGVSVYDMQAADEGWNVYTNDGMMSAKNVLLATGAAEKAIPIPGWTLPGVMSIGAAQVMTNVHRVKVGSRGIVIGINALSMAILHELILGGVSVSTVVLPPPHEMSGDAAKPEHVMQSLSRLTHLAPSPIIRWAGKGLKSRFLQRAATRFYPKSGMKIWGVPIHLRRAALEIYGENQVEGVRVAKLSTSGKLVAGTTQEIPADFVCIAGGLFPLAELASVAGCPFIYVPELGGHVPFHRENMQTPLKGLYVAGNITGIESAKVAMDQGTVAGLSIALEGGTNQIETKQRLANAIEQVRTARSQAPFQFHPHVQAGRDHMQKLQF